MSMPLYWDAQVMYWDAHPLLGVEAQPANSPSYLQYTSDTGWRLFPLLHF
jgi:hypothetical protein